MIKILIKFKDKLGDGALISIDQKKSQSESASTQRVVSHQQYPQNNSDYMTQAETIQELQETLRNIHSDLTF